MKRNVLVIFILIITLLPIQGLCAAEIGGVELQLKSAMLMETSSGEVLYDFNADEQRQIASVTKIMTMLLIMEQIDSGTLSFDDMVTTSERASKMGGSQVYLKAGEQMTVHDMMKAIAVASGNDATVVMAEHICGSEEAFVARMNERAKELGMNNTLFVNSNGLDDDQAGYSTARDVAIMSRELISHPRVIPFTSIWMDSLRGGEFALVNTNRLMRFYSGANGIKTGSTDKAGYCLSASAQRDGMQLIAVVLGAPSTNERFNSATKLLDYGFANYAVITESIAAEESYSVLVSKGAVPEVAAVMDISPEKMARMNVLVPKLKKNMVRKQVNMMEAITAPVKVGQKLGEVEFWLDDEKLGTLDLVAASQCKRMNVLEMFGCVINEWLGKA